MSVALNEGKKKSSSSANFCSDCGASNCFEVDNARGDSVCTNCGSVQKSHQSQFIVSSVEFQETGGGPKQVIGGYVDSDGFAKFNTGMHGGVSVDSKAISFANARRIIEGIAYPMHIPYQIIDMAHNFYKMCYNRSMTRGRKLKILCSACIYIACRLELTSHMLCDFCSQAQADVSTLGRYFSSITSALNIKLPVIDPSLYIPRFAEKLELGDKTNDITRVAINLVSGMQRDWMSTGRRPSGLCASALLIASRLYGFHRTLDDVLRIFKIHKSTLVKRLEEFTEMPASSLTYNDTINIPDDDSVHSVQNPPCLNAVDMEDLVFDEAKKQKIQSEILVMKDEIEDLIDKQIIRKESKSKNEKKEISEKTQVLILKHKEKDLLDEVIDSDIDDSEIENSILNADEVDARKEILSELVKESEGNLKNGDVKEFESYNNGQDVNGEEESDEICDDQNLDEMILKHLQQNGNNEPKRLKYDGPSIDTENQFTNHYNDNLDNHHDYGEEDHEIHGYTGDPSSILANAQYI